MKLGNGVYVDIAIKGSGKHDFINEKNLRSFTMVETAGTSLPYISFSFVTTDKDIVEFFNEKNDREIEVSIGSSPDKIDTFIVQLIPTRKNNDPSDKTATIDAGGFLCSKPYMVDRGECRAYTGNSLMVTKQILERYDGLNNDIDSDFETVDEDQVVWRQTYETSSMYLIYTLLHMNVQPSFPLFSFDKYGKFHLKNFDKLVKAGPVVKFTPFSPNKGEIRYLNNFNVDSYRATYNLYSGYNKITEIYGVETGMPAFNIAENTPLIASTTESDTSKAGNRISLNKFQSKNVHKKFAEAYAHNTNKLVALSSMQGVLLLNGYYPELKPTDLVYVETPKENGEVSSLEGNYLIDTVVLKYEYRDKLLKTLVTVTRDDSNNIENFITNREEKRKNQLKINRITLQELANAVARTRIAIASCSQIMDGTFISSLRNYVTYSKNNLLRSFSVAGVLMDFTSQARMLQSFLLLGNNLMNILFELIFPAQIARVLRNLLIERPTARGLVDNYIYECIPFELQGLISDLVDSLWEVHDSLNSIAKDNNITVKEIPEVAQGGIEYTEDDNRVGEIIQQFENNTTGLDIPFPIINLTESQELMSDKELKEYVALETISNLMDLGYLDDLSEDEIKELQKILLGEIPINFALIDKINRAAGEKYNYRFWGTYGSTGESLFAWAYKDNIVYTKKEELSVYTKLYNNDFSPYQGTDFIVSKDAKGSYKIYYKTHITERYESEDVISNALSQLTNYYISKGYKDKYRTIPCTKFISATKNARLYFACPATELNIKFYINSKRVELDSFPIDLGYTDVYGNKLIYNVYFTTTGYNSNSTMLEVRQ